MIPVAAYCRVSTDRDDQANSFASQQRYFAEYICRQPDWSLFEIYADEGITGTSTRKRAAFNRMIDEAHRREIPSDSYKRGQPFFPQYFRHHHLYPRTAGAWCRQCCF